MTVLGTNKMPLQNGGPIAALRTQPNMASGLPKPATTVKPALHRIEQARVMARHRETEAMFRSVWTPDASLDIVADILLRLWAWTDEDTNTFLGTSQPSHFNQSDVDDLLDTDAGLDLGVMADWSDRSQASRADREDRARLQVRLWVYRTIRDMECCHSVVVGALIFVYRLRHSFAKDPNPPLPRKHLFLMCLLMSSKMLYDVPYTNGQWADVCNLPVKEFNRMEHIVLASLNFSVEIDPELHRKTAIYLDEISGGPLYGEVAAKRVSKSAPRKETATKVEGASWVPTPAPPTQATSMAAMCSTIPAYPARPVPAPRPNTPKAPSTSGTETVAPVLPVAAPVPHPTAPTFTSIPARSRNPTISFEQKMQSEQQAYHPSKVRVPARAATAADVQSQAAVVKEGKTDEAEASANKTAKKVAHIGKSASADRLPIRSVPTPSHNLATVTQSLVSNLVCRVVQAQRSTNSDLIDQLPMRSSAIDPDRDHAHDCTRTSQVIDTERQAPNLSGGASLVVNGFRGNRENVERSGDSLRKSQPENEKQAIQRPTGHTNHRQHQPHGGSIKTNTQIRPVCIKHAAESALRQGATLRVNGFNSQSDSQSTEISPNKANSRSSGITPPKARISRPITPNELSPLESDLPKPMETGVTFRSVPQRPAEAAKRVQMEMASGGSRGGLIGQIHQASTWESVMAIVLKGPAACLGAPTLPPPSAKAGNTSGGI